MTHAKCYRVRVILQGRNLGNIISSHLCFCLLTADDEGPHAGAKKCWMACAVYESSCLREQLLVRAAVSEKSLV